MTQKPQTYEGYAAEQTELVESTCLYVATKLGDLLDDMMIVGGLVPSLIIEQETRSGDERHVGTMDLDLGLMLALLNDELYKTLSERLRDAGLQMDTNDRGNPTRQRWVIHEPATVTIDFLIPTVEGGPSGGRIFNLDHDFAAVIAPGLHCAFRDRVYVTLSGLTIMGDKATRDIPTCSAGGFIVLKALAWHHRTEPKDAYDIYYVLRHFGDGVEDVAARLRPLLDDEHAQHALDILERDFLDPDSVGPRNVARFIDGQPNDIIQADTVGFVYRLLSLLKHDHPE